MAASSESAIGARNVATVDAARAQFAGTIGFRVE
jgi:hypothetical protein